MDVGAWLTELGLEKYAEAFAANEIDFDALPYVTEKDLREIGIALGARRKLLAAIARLELKDEPTEFEATSDRLISAEAERRQLTVMFVDLVGSTELSSRLDPEDVRVVIRAYQNAVAGEIGRFEGHLAKFMGDGVLAYFGWPRAHEDEAERAVRAGLAVTRAVKKLKTPDSEALACRIGIATGLVVVGDLVGEGAAQEEAVVGETPNIAARLQDLAEPGSVVVASDTRRLLGDLLETVDLGNHALKGIADPVHAWQVLREGRTESRFQALHGGKLTALIGRDEEFGLLLSRWRHATEGEGQVVLLSGGAGIGKSRIIQTLRESLLEGVTPLRYQCSPYFTNSALYPVIAQLERAAGFARDDDIETRFSKLEAVLWPTDRPTEQTFALIGALLSLPIEDRYPPLNTSPHRQLEDTFEVVVEQLEALCRNGPVLILVEDAHLTDPTTTDLMGQLIDAVALLPVLHVITFRPEFTPPWPRHAHVTTLTLNRLGRANAAEMVARVAGKPLPPEVESQILDKTDGVPLFVEELTKTVLEKGLLTDTGERYELAGALPSLVIPSTLQDSLMARLDRASPVKETAQIGAAIGREFSYELLAAVSPLRDHELTEAMQELVEAELVFQRGTPPAARYQFKHVLVRDAAYQTLLKSRRRQLHARIAAALEELYPDVAANQPEVLARHLTDAGLADRAIHAWQRAGEKAIGRSANAEAIAHLGKALELTAGMPETIEWMETELVLQTKLAVPTIFVKGSGSAAQPYERAGFLCDRLGRTDELFAILRGHWNVELDRGELRHALSLGEELIGLADQEGDALRQALSRRAFGSSLFYFGRFVEAANQLQQGIVLDDALSDLERRASVSIYGDSAGVVCRSYAGCNLWFSGFPDRAIRILDEALVLSRELSFTHSIGFALVFSAIIHNLRRDFAAALPVAEEAIINATEQGLVDWVAFGSMCRGRALTGLGEISEGIELLRSGLTKWHDTGSRLADSQWYGFLAAAYLDAQKFDNAWAALDEAYTVRDATGELLYQAELDRLRGILLLESGDAAEAEVHLQNAIDRAHEQGAKSLELRAAASLARLWIDQGRREQAEDLLAPIYGWFTEGFDTTDLKDAKALLEQLA
ncbi:MAG: adenylate/guanylate cyclase domain-containing protein [Hyphomicrobiaceae bacterium]